jgi:pyridoxamine 5'-phosphate oxidase
VEDDDRSGPDYIPPMSNDPLIPASPSADDYVAQVTTAEPLPLLPEADPFDLFEAWLKAALESEPNDANAMALSTVDTEGMPDSRMVLLKGVDTDGFTFFTNLGSAKGRELAATPKAALLFHWKSLRRQVRIRGLVEQVPDAEADAYFATRARPSQLGAWASDQSRPLTDRFALEKKVAEAGLRFGLGKVPRPPHWSGFRLRPQTMEFWRDRPFRLHERLVFGRSGNGWTTQRLFP